jgi:hypothetical protein
MIPLFHHLLTIFLVLLRIFFKSLAVVIRAWGSLLINAFTVKLLSKIAAPNRLLAGEEKPLII